PVLRVGRSILAFGDHRPALGQFGVQRHQRLLACRHVVFGVNRVDRALRLAQGAVDALVRIDHQEIGAFVEGIDRTHLDTIGVLALDAIVDDNKGHGVNSAVRRVGGTYLRTTADGSRGVRQRALAKYGERALVKSAAMDGRFRSVQWPRTAGCRNAPRQRRSSMIAQANQWRSLRDSNSCSRLERAVSWATRRRERYPAKRGSIAELFRTATRGWHRWKRSGYLPRCACCRHAGRSAMLGIVTHGNHEAASPRKDSNRLNLDSRTDLAPTLRIIPRDQHIISRKNISKAALRVLYRLNEAGYAAYLVGGAVRDLLLGVQPKDFDVATSATPDEVKKLFRNCRLIGRRFRLAHVVFGPEIIEVATFRGTGEEGGEGDRHIIDGRIV